MADDQVLSTRLPAQPIPLIATFLLAAFLLLPSMASVGMFMDGTIYAAISRNLAEGLGSMWAPYFSEGLFPVFREHPPLVFWLQSLFFRVLGDTYLTERAYDLVALVVTALLMRVLWRKLAIDSGNPGLAEYWWLPLLLWIVVPKWSWAYRNNVLESTMTVFCLLSVLLSLYGLRVTSAPRAVLAAALAACAALLAFLAKGPVSLFVLAVPVLLLPALPRVDLRRAVVVAVVSPVFFVLGLCLLLYWSEAREMLALYWQKQVMGRTGVSSADFGMLFELAKKLAPMLVVLAGFRLWIRRDATAGGWKSARGPAFAMFAIGLAASVPLLLGDLDSAHYLVPALPFLALGLGFIGAGMLDNGGSRVRRALTASPGPLFMIMAGTVVVGILFLTTSRIGEVRKNVDYHAFLAQVADVVGDQRVVAIDDALYEDWYLHAIAQRHHRISLVKEQAVAEWRLAPVSSSPADGYRESGIGNRHWALRRRNIE